MNTDREHRQSWRKCEPAPRYRKGGNGNPLPKTVNGKYQASAESPERRTLAEGNFVHMPAARTQCRGQSQDVLYRIRKAAKRDKNLRFNNLMHHISIDLLRECFYGLKRKASPGIDGKTWYEYRETLEQRLPKLHLEIQSNRYRAKPSLRTSISKENGEQRLLGIAALEDKVVQLATVKVLESIYEADFMGFSYGFRPGRSQHDALDALAVALKLHKVNWIIDADIRKFFDRMDHEILMRFISHRIADKRILRLIKKWLTAGVIVDGKLIRTDIGSPQGAVISPLLANIFLHYTFDLWIHNWRNKYARGNIRVIRYADDIVIGCECRDDSRTLHTALFERFAKFELQLHPEKTRRVEFGRFATEHMRSRGKGKPETFNFLGFTHICSKQSNNGKFKVLRISRSDRMRNKLQEVKEWLKRNMHLPIPLQGKYLRSVVQGWFNYHAIPGNNKAISRFRFIVSRYWFRALRRRSQKGVRLKWDRMNNHIEKWLPVAIVIHPYPEERFDVNTRSRSRMP